MDPKFFEPNIFWSQNFLGPKNFLDPIHLFWPQIFGPILHLIYFLSKKLFVQKSFGPNIFLDPNIFNQSFYQPKIFWTQFFSSRIFLQNNFRTQNCFGPKIYLYPEFCKTQHFFDINLVGKCLLGILVRLVEKWPQRQYITERNLKISL